MEISRLTYKAAYFESCFFICFFNIKLFAVTVILLMVIAIDAIIGLIVIPKGLNSPTAIGIIQIL